MDAPTPEELEQLARSLSMSPTVGDRDRHRIVDLLRQFARHLKPT